MAINRRLFVEADACRRIARGQSVTLLLMQLSIAGGPRARDFRAVGCWLLVVHRILWLRFRSGFLLRFHQSFSSAFPFHPTILEPDFNLKKSSQNCAIRGPTCICKKVAINMIPSLNECPRDTVATSIGLQFKRMIRNN